MRSMIVALAVCMLLSSAAVADIVVSTAAPTGDLAKVAQPNGGNDVRDPFYTSAGSRRANGASFNLQGSEQPFAWNTITMRMRVGAEGDTPLAGSEWVVSMFTLSGDNDNTADTILVDRVSAGTLPALTYGADNYITFVIPNTVNVVAGQQYGFIVDFASANINNRLSGDGQGWVGSSNNERGDTMGLISNVDAGDAAFSFWSSGGDDIIFFVGTQEIPEPATMALLAVGAVGALIRRRK